MRVAARYLFPVLVALLTYAALNYFFPRPPKPETAQLRCNFALAAGERPVSVPTERTEITKLVFAAQLSNPSAHNGLSLWQADGTATADKERWELDGPVFSNQSNRIQGFGLWRTRPGTRRQNLRILTLNEDGILDWDERSAFVSFDGDNEKLGHRFDYRCKLVRGVRK